MAKVPNGNLGEDDPLIKGFSLQYGHYTCAIQLDHSVTPVWSHSAFCNASNGHTTAQCNSHTILLCTSHTTLHACNAMQR